MLRISEIFESIQGEGRYAGTPSLFVRTTGCNLRCWFCDTPYTSWKPEGEQHPWQSISARLQDSACEHVVVTGGEPLLQPDVIPLTRALAEAGKFITIETAGTVDRQVHADLMSISPKLANSTPRDSLWAERHDRLRDRPDVMFRLIGNYDYQLKFVIDQPGDLRDVEVYLTRFPQVAPDRVWLMPQATDVETLHEKTAWLTTAADERGYHVSPRLHIELFGNTRGT